MSIKKIYIALLSVVLLFGGVTHVSAEGTTLIPSGDEETFINNVPINEITMYIDMDKITMDNLTWTSNIEGLIEHETSDDAENGISLVYQANDMQVGQTISLDGKIEVVYKDAVVLKSDGSRADIKVTVSDIQIGKYREDTKEIKEKYILIFALPNMLYTTGLDENYVSLYKNDVKLTKFNRQEKVSVQILKNNQQVDGKLAYGIKDLDIPYQSDPDKDYQHNYEHKFSESVEPVSGFGDLYVTSGTLLVDDNGRIRGSGNDSNTWNSGFISIVAGDFSFIWRAGGSSIGTDLFNAIPIYIVKDSVIGGGESKYVNDGQEVDEAVIFAKEGSEVNIVTRPLEGHKIKKITVDGEDVTPTDRISDFTYRFEDINDDHEIIAEYEPFTYKINYDGGDGGQGTMSSDVFTFDDETFMTKENEFTKDHHKFVGFKLEGRDELITSPEDLRELLVGMGDGAEVTLVAQWEYEPITQFVDIDTDEELIPEEVGEVDPKDIDGYVYIITEKDDQNNQVHKYKAVKTHYIDEEGTPLLDPKPGKKESENIPGYKLVKTEDDPKGDTTYTYHKVKTSWVDEHGKVLHSAEDGTLDPKVFPGYKLVKTETKPNGDTVHIYHQIQTSWIDEKGTPIIDSKTGEHVKQEITGYEFVRTTTATNGDIIHHYDKLINLKFNVDGKTVKEENLKRGSDGTAPTNPTKTGYTFTGWDKEFKNLQVDTVVNAKFEPIKYPITYVLDGGTNDKDNPSSYTIDDAFTIKNPVKLGYKFLGWKESSSIAKGSTGEKTFTAQWELVSNPVNTGFGDITSYVALMGLSTMMAVVITRKKKEH